MIGRRGVKITSRDVAATAGVSYRTVGRVLAKCPNVGPAALPADLSVVSFDDTPTARTSVPPITAIHQPTAKMTARAAELLIGALGKSDAAPHIIPFELIVRQSSAPVRA